MKNLYRVLSYTKRYWKQLTVSIVAASLFGIVSALPTYLLKHIVDEVFINRYSAYILPFMAAFFMFFVFKAVFMFITNYYMHWVGTHVVNDIRAELFDKIIRFPMSFFHSTTTGTLMSSFLNDIAMIQQASSSAIKDGIRSFFEAVFLIGMAFYQNFTLGSIMFIIGPVIGVTIKYAGRARKKASHTIQHEMGLISAVLQESFIGVREIKAFNAESTETNRLKKRLDTCFNAVMRSVAIESFAPACVEVTAVFGCCFVFYIAAHQVLSGTISAGQLTSFVAATLLSYQPLKKLINVYSDIQYGLAAADRVFDLMDKHWPTMHNRTRTLTTFTSTIVFNSVDFAYNPSQQVFKNFCLTIKKGETIGVMGPSGAGKSTFCDLLLGFINPTSGHITIDGIDITHLSYQSLREHIGYVGQRTFLFNDTVANNVAYASPGATQDDIIAACTTAHAHDFIQNLPQGYQTIVGENGNLLSGGQKQRITIARALLKNPDIIIFDEATSSLDAESEQMIKEAINDISHDKTIIIISHRPALLEGADRILTIDGIQTVAIEACPEL